MVLTDGDWLVPTAVRLAGGGCCDITGQVAFVSVR